MRLGGRRTSRLKSVDMVRFVNEAELEAYVGQVEELVVGFGRGFGAKFG